MIYRWRPSWFRRLECGVVLLFVCAVPLAACGPDFPETYYDMDGRRLLDAPEGYFAVEIARIAREIVPAQRAVVAGNLDFGAANQSADAIELPRALADRGVPERVAKTVTESYLEIRKQLEVAKVSRSDWSKVPVLAQRLPAELPVEFATYFRGAEAWARGQTDEARAAWQGLLQLPAADRHFRSTWAAFMLGRSWQADAASESESTAAADTAVRYFREVRTGVSEGYADALGLGVASLGEEAKTELQRKSLAAAVRLYLEQQAADDPTAIDSLRMVAARIATLSAVDWTQLAKDAAVRRVFTAYLITRGRFPEDDVPMSPGGESAEKLAQRWALALKEAGVRIVPEADRLAWVAYEGGLFALAREWSELAPANAPEAEWIRAKLALRDGNLAAGEKFLRSALMLKPLAEGHRTRLEAELGRVCLAEDNFAGALSAWIEGGQREDAAYVAERVMTTAELVAYVDVMAVVPPRVASIDVSQKTLFIRHLLARRLARAGKLREAAGYFPLEYRADFVRYTDDVQAGFNATHSPAERAGAFWRAARELRSHGMEFLGTELEPDWAIWDGNYSLDPAVEARLGTPVSAGGIFAPTALETTRLQDQPAPVGRFHYRYRAAELAWWAASLLPNESEETAEILNTAGGWLKNRDPSAAKPFYQAMVIRCGHTELGQAAAAQRWFPD